MRVLSASWWLIISLAILSACGGEEDRGGGEPCLNGNECQSGICAGSLPDRSNWTCGYSPCALPDDCPQNQICIGVGLPWGVENWCVDAASASLTSGGPP